MRAKFFSIVSILMLIMQEAAAEGAEGLPKKDGRQLGLNPQKPQAKTNFSANHPFNRALISAFNTNPDLRSAVKKQYALAESVSQALGGWRPSISLQGTMARSWQDIEAPAEASRALWTTTKNAQVTLQQNLFKGGQTVAQTEGAKANVYAGFAQLADVEQELLLTTVNVYLDLWAKRAILELNRNNVKVKQKTLDQTKARYDVGEVTLTDVAQAEAGLAAAIAQQIAAEADVKGAEEAYVQVVGEMPGDVPPPPPLVELRQMPQNRQEVESKALKNHPKIRSAQYSKQASLAAIDEATSALLPSVDVQASASRNLQFSDSNSRTNSASFGITMTIPIYQQGNEWSKIRQATQTAAQAKIDVVAVSRKVLQAAVQNWENWRAYADQIEQMKIQVEAAKISVEGTRAENLVGERTVLDVLTAENAQLQAETNLINAQKNYLAAGYAILSSMGEMTAVSLNLPVEPYPVKENYESVSTQLVGTNRYPTR